MSDIIVGSANQHDIDERSLLRNSYAIRKAPLWNQGLLEGFWFIRIDSSKPSGSRLVDASRVLADGDAFFDALISELKLREPAIPFTR